MELVFLGTGAGMPSRKRNVSAVALNLLDEAGVYWLFDCGEGTQQQILRSPVKLSRLDKIFITHLHGDHIYGLPGLLSSRSYQGGETPLTVYGPKGIQEFVESVLRISQSRLTYTLHIEEITEGTVFQGEAFTVEAAKLEHRIECYGYRIVEKDQEGPLNAEKLKQLGVPPGPLYGELKRGKTITLPNGTEIGGKDVLGPSIPGRIVAVLGDTLKTEASVLLARDADVLVHEATFSGNRLEMAKKYQHATSVEAAQVAEAACAKALILTHISSRYGEEEGAELLQEAREVFPETYLAEDFWTFDIPRK